MDKLIELGIQKRNGQLNMSWNEIGNIFNKSGEYVRCKVKQYLKRNGDLPGIYEKNRLIDAIAVQSNNMRIGVKLSSNSLVYFPILHELGFIVETINGDKVYLNV